MVKEVRKMPRSEIGWVLFVVEKNETAHPGHVSGFSSKRIMSDADGVAQLLEEFWRWLWWVGHWLSIKALA